MNNEELIDALSECRKAVRECLSTPESCAKLASLKAALEARRNEAQEVIDELEKKESKTDDLINELERSNDLLTAQILEFKKRSRMHIEWLTGGGNHPVCIRVKKVMKNPYIIIRLNNKISITYWWL